MYKKIDCGLIERNRIGRVNFDLTIKIRRHVSKQTRVFRFPSAKADLTTRVSGFNCCQFQEAAKGRALENGFCFSSPHPHQPQSWNMIRLATLSRSPTLKPAPV